MRLALAASSALIALGAAAVATSQGPVHRAPVVDRGKLSASTALTRARLLGIGVSVTGRRARELTVARQHHIPLPDGGSFTGIRWELATGPIPAEQVETVIESNAMCQWLRASQEGRERATAVAILAQITRWPAMHQATPTDPQTLIDCYRSHEREVRYAASNGKAPST